ncbi:MAG: YbjN domain-containing protein, partial [Anaerolineales bacterium]|nr:YbjN domain-containing protein [Anaerolineales bacterium]
MDFKTEAQKVCYQNIYRWLTEIFGEFVLENKEQPSFAIQRGSALVEIWIFPWREDDSMVGVRSWVVTDADLRPDL